MRNQLVQLLWLGVMGIGTALFFKGSLNKTLSSEQIHSSLDTALCAAGVVMLVFGITQLLFIHLRKK
jgi:predicted phage tail protein